MEFKYIRNRIGEYSRNSLLECSLGLLKAVEKDYQKPFPYWNLLLLIKWILLYADQQYPPKIAVNETVHHLLAMIGELHDSHPLFKNYGQQKTNQLMMMLGYQQFYLQLPIRKDTFARQIQLYTKIKSSYSIEELFKSRTNLSIEDFINCSFFLWAYTSPKQASQSIPYDGVIYEDFVSLIDQIVPHEVIKSFMELLVIDESFAMKVVSEDNRVRTGELQLYEITIFTQHPVLFFNNQLYILHRNILNYTLNHFIYDFLKNQNEEQFSIEFGHRLEKYVELGLNEIPLRYRAEVQLKKELPEGSKLVDFLVEDEILIECKAIEMKPYPNVYPDNDVIFKWLKSSIVKAYSQQMLEVANNLGDHNEKFGIIITYKETYFGQGLDAWNSFLKSPTEAYANENNFAIDLIPPQNLFFVDIATWDEIILVIKEGKATLREILENAKKDDENPTTKKFLFSMHLKEYDTGAFGLTYLNEGYTQVMSNLLKRANNP